MDVGGRATHAAMDGGSRECLEPILEDAKAEPRRRSKLLLPKPQIAASLGLLLKNFVSPRRKGAKK